MFKLGIKNLVQSLLKNFQGWVSFQEWVSFQGTYLEGKKSSFRNTFWEFLIHAQFYMHVSFLTFSYNREDLPFEDSAKRAIITLSVISLVIDLATKTIVYFEILSFQQKNRLVFLSKAINLQIEQVLFLIVLETGLLKENVLAKKEFDKFFTLFINYYLNAIIISIGWIRWDLFIIQNFLTFLIFKSIQFIKLQNSEDQLENNYIEKASQLCIHGAIILSSITLILAIRRNSNQRKILKALSRTSSTGKIIIKGKNVLWSNDALRNIYLIPSVTYDNLNSLVFRLYLNVKQKAHPQNNYFMKSSSRKGSPHMVKKLLSLSEIFEALRKTPTQILTFYTQIKQRSASSPSQPHFKKENQGNQNNDFKIINTEAGFTTIDEFADIFPRQIQVKVSHLNWETLGDEYIYIEFNDYGEAQSVIEAEEMIEYKTNILNSFSHELKTPLNISKNLIDLVVSEVGLPKKLKDKFIIPAQASLNMLSYLIHDIVDFLKIETNQLDLEVNQFDLKQLVKEILDLFAFRTQERGIAFILNNLGSESSFVYTDRMRLMRVLINIISFIVKNNNNMGIAVNISSKIQGGLNLTIQRKPNKEHFKYNAEKPNFSSFKNKSPLSRDLDCSRENDFGLIISRMILENLINEGVDSFTLTNLEDDDILFKISMPSAAERTSEERIIASHNIGSLEVLEVTSRVGANLPLHFDNNKSENIADLNLKHPKTYDCPQVLVVDDDPFNILSLCLIFEKKKVNIIQASNGLEAIELCQKHQSSHKCDNPQCTGIKVILMDLMMPVMNGLESCKILLQMMKNRLIPEIPIFACTANDSRENMTACKEIGFTGFISKPVNPLMLRKELKIFLKWD